MDKPTVLHEDNRPLTAGSRIHGYVLVERIGEGGMGEIWQVCEEKSGRRAALKLLRDPSRANNARLIREARLVRRIAHPNVIRVNELLRSSSGAIALAMEHLEGEGLERRLATSGALPLPFACRLGAAIASALAATHAAGVVHRDVKPANVFLAVDGQRLVPKLLDFGVAARIEDVSTSPEIVGTPGYMAPEQATGGPVDARADTWALGLIFYECITGRRLFDEQDLTRMMQLTIEAQIPMLHTLMLGIPIAISDLVARMLERNPERRLADLRLIYDVFFAHSGFGESDLLVASSAPTVPWLDVA
jgi:serine/threonine-protein kinase